MAEKELLKSLDPVKIYLIHREFLGHSKKYDHKVDILEFQDEDLRYFKIINFI